MITPSPGRSGSSPATAADGLLVSGYLEGDALRERFAGRVTRPISALRITTEGGVDYQQRVCPDFVSTPQP